MKRITVSFWIALATLAAGAGGLAAQASAQDSPEMRALRQYVGTWRSEDREGQDGRTSHFLYRLTWFDPGETIAEMLITQHFADGEERLLWKGFKGWHPGSETAYYHGFSPSGRAASGTLHVEGDGLVTAYEGWSAEGPGVMIRDVFEPVEGDTFVAHTWLKREGSDWREVNVDHWTRLEDGP